MPIYHVEFTFKAQAVVVANSVTDLVHRCEAAAKDIGHAAVMASYTPRSVDILDVNVLPDPDLAAVTAPGLQQVK